MDKDELIRYFERRLKLRSVHEFDRVQESIGDLEREFAIEALDLMRRQPAMEAILGAEPQELELRH